MISIAASLLDWLGFAWGAPNKSHISIQSTPQIMDLLWGKTSNHPEQTQLKHVYLLVSMARWKLPSSLSRGLNRKITEINGPWLPASHGADDTRGYIIIFLWFSHFPIVFLWFCHCHGADTKEGPDHHTTKFSPRRLASRPCRWRAGGDPKLSRESSGKAGNPRVFDGFKAEIQKITMVYRWYIYGL